jgi:hypothetical protein
MELKIILNTGWSGTHGEPIGVRMAISELSEELIISTLKPTAHSECHKTHGQTNGFIRPHLRKRNSQK